MYVLVKILNNSAQPEMFGPVESSLLAKLVLIGLAYQRGFTVHYYLQFIFTIHF